MTLAEIYETYQIGSSGFVRAVEQLYAYNITRTEIERIAAKAPTAEEFQRIWENDDDWLDA